MKSGIDLITEERERQISKEGWTPEHDDQHDLGQLCSAAGCYIFAGDCLANAAVMDEKYKCTPASLTAEIFDNPKLISWPFEEEALKIDADPIRSLVKAGALIAAEIDRLQRYALPPRRQRGRSEEMTIEMNATIERKAGAGSAAAHGSDLYSWEVSVKGTDWTRTVNARTSGQAKSDYHRDISDPWPDIPYTAIRCRKIGAPHTSKQFVRNAEYRSLPNVKCGQRVKVGDEFGVIVGHNSSANFDVLFDEDSKYRGQTLNCHPDSCEMVNGQNDQAHGAAGGEKPTQTH